MNRSMGQVVELFIGQKDNSQRVPQTIIEVDAKGIIGDKFYAKEIDRSILLASIESYQLALDNGIEMPYGTLGENILIDYNPYALTIGTQLKIGKVILEVTQNCTICNHLSVIDKRLPRLLKEDRGIFVKVITPGSIEKSNRVYL